MFKNIHDVADYIESLVTGGTKVFASQMTQFGEHIEPSRVIDELRNKRFIPIKCERGKNGIPTYWYMTCADIAMYHNFREFQKSIYKQAYQKKKHERLLHNLAKEVEQYGKEYFFEYIDNLEV